MRMFTLTEAMQDVSERLDAFIENTCHQAETQMREQGATEQEVAAALEYLLASFRAWRPRGMTDIRRRLEHPDAPTATLQ